MTRETTMARGSMPPAGASDEPSEPEPRSRWQIEVELVEDAGAWGDLGAAGKLLESIRLQLAAAPEFADTPPASATVVLSDDATVAALNASYRGKAGPTNVLSFPPPARPTGPDGANEASFIGDVILADGTVQREARELAIPLAHHVQHLMLHGLLHLAGFDHESEEEARRMESLETRLLAALGIPDPYAEGDGVTEEGAAGAMSR